MIDRRRFLQTLSGAGAALWLPRIPRPASRDPIYVERWSWAMGQPVVLRLFAGSEAQGYAAAQAAFAELRRVEGVLSRFDMGSDLSALNDRAGRGPVHVDQDLVRVLTVAEGLRHQTAGAFDPAIEPVMRAWGFHAVRREAPTTRELDDARGAVRAARVRIEGDRIALDGRGSALDLGGIGVGYGLDRAAAVLRTRGIEAALLDISGDLLAIGAPPGERGWRVDLADPGRRGASTGTVYLKDAALATSANTEETLRWRGRLVGHVMDPHTARPAERVRQVTVEGPSGVLADAWSTALLVAPVPLPARCRAHVVA